MFVLLSNFAAWLIPLLLLAILLLAAFKKVRLYETFINGAEDGFKTAIQTIPFLVGMLVAIHVFRDSGALDITCSYLSPLLDFLHFPVEVLPHALVRPISGGAALGIASDLIQTHGPDSFLGQLVSVMQGTTDTTFYILTLYFGSVGITRYRYALLSGLTADLVTLIASVVISYQMFA